MLTSTDADETNNGGSGESSYVVLPALEPAQAAVFLYPPPFPTVNAAFAWPHLAQTAFSGADMPPCRSKPPQLVPTAMAACGRGEQRGDYVPATQFTGALGGRDG